MPRAHIQPASGSARSLRKPRQVRSLKAQDLVFTMILKETDHVIGVGLQRCLKRAELRIFIVRPTSRWWIRRLMIARPFSPGRDRSVELLHLDVGGIPFKRHVRNE